MLAATIDRTALIAPAQRVLVGVSGGLDSVVLLAALRTLSEADGRRYHLAVAHLNHGLRSGADEDEAFVAELAGRWQLPVVIEQCDVAALAERQGEGLEQAGRSARYAFFRRAAAQVDAELVAVAHHADDNVETVLFRLCRGTGLRGLSGMPIRRPLGAELTLIRPLLDLRRVTLHDWAQQQGLGWREDPTNAEATFTRNAIRHDLLPMIRTQIHPGVDEAVLRLACQARQADALLTRQADGLLERSVAFGDSQRVLIDVSMFTPADPLVRTTAIRRAIEQLVLPQRNLTAEHLEQVDQLFVGPADQSGTVVNLPGPAEARRQGSQVILRRIDTDPPGR
jgi:tRNA(Ile)-lysidine synthase